MSDLLEQLKKWANDEPDILKAEMLNDAIAEIEYLRSVAGAVTRGESHADIKERI